MVSIVFRINLVFTLLITSIFLSAQKLPSDFILNLQTFYLNEGKLKWTDSFQDYILDNQGIDSLKIEEVFYYPYDTEVDTSFYIKDFEKAFLKVNMKNCNSGYTFVFLLNHEYQILDVFYVKRYFHEKRKYFMSEVWTKGDSLKVDVYELENQDIENHPYLTKVVSSRIVYADDMKWFFIKDW